MKTTFLKKIRKATSGTLVLALLFSVLNPFGHVTFATNGAISGFSAGATGITVINGPAVGTGDEAGTHSIVVTDSAAAYWAGADAEGSTADTIAFAITGDETLTFNICNETITTSTLTGATAGTTTLTAVATDIQSKINATTSTCDVTVTVAGNSPTKYFVITANVAGLNNNVNLTSGTNGGDTDTGLAGGAATAGVDARAVDTFTPTIASNGQWVVTNSGSTKTIVHTTAAGVASTLVGLTALTTVVDAFVEGVTLVSAGLTAGTASFEIAVPTGQDTVFASSVSKMGGAATAIVSSGDATNSVWFAPSSTTTFVANGTTITTASGTVTSILAPATAGVYKIFVIDAAGNASAPSGATLTVDNTAPVITSTGSIVTNTGSVTFSGITVIELNFSGATLSYSGVANSTLTGTIDLAGTISNLTGSLSGLNSNATYYYEITATDVSGNTITLPAGTFSTLFDYAALYNQIGTALDGSGITNNFTGVTNENVTAFPDLTFGNTFGNIRFVNSLDLTDSGTISFLQNLGSKFSAGTGNTIGLTTSGSTFQGYPAIITATFPAPILPNGTGNENMIVVRDDLGNILDGSGILSNMTCAIGIGGDQTCFFNTAHFTTFDFKPTAQVEYSSTGLTNQDVITTLTGASEAITITNNNGMTRTFTGNGIFTFEFVDNSGNTGSTVATVTNIDKTVPVISLIGSGALTIPLGSSYTDSGATWWDNVDGTGSLTASGTVTTSATGAYTLTYTKTDTAGNTGVTVARTVTVADQTAPVVVLNGSATGTINFGGTYVDSGATWSDNLDGTGTVTASGTVDTMTLGTYMLSYTKTDVSGNISNIVTRSIEVVATPVTGSGTISGPADLTGSTIASGSGLDTNSLVLLINSSGSDLASLSGTLTVSGVTLITVSGSVWGGVLLPPTSVASGSTDNATLGELGILIPQDTSTTDYTNTILQTIQAGGGSGVSLTASGANFQISVLVSLGTAGDTLKLYRSSNGTSWVANSPDATCTLTASKMCTFSTDHLSYFATVKTTSVAITQPSSSGGGGSTSKDTCPNGDYTTSYYDGLCGTTVSLSGATIDIQKTKNEVTVTTTTASGTTTNIFHIPGQILKTLKDVQFKDISSNWAKGYIEKLVTRGIIDNVEKYNPDNNLTRAEFLKIAFNTAGWETSATGTTVFKDVASDVWYAPYVSLAVSKGIISSKSMNFRPNDTISRAEAAKIIVGIFGGNTANKKITFADVYGSSDLAKYIETAKDLGFFSGQLIDGKLHFRPNEAITRAEIAKVIVSAFGL